MRVLDRPDRPVELKHQHGIKALGEGLILQGFPRRPMQQVIGADLVDTGLGHLLVRVGADKQPEAEQLGLGVLAFVAGTDPRVQGDAHNALSFLLVGRQNKPVEGRPRDPSLYGPREQRSGIPRIGR